MVSTRSTKDGTTPLLVVAMALLLAITIPVFAQETTHQDSSHEMKVPESARDHSQMAEHYQKVAAQTREDIEGHKKMLADFTKTATSSPKAGENPYTRKMRQHCERYIKAAEALVAEADASAKFHSFRAKELEGK